MIDATNAYWANYNRGTMMTVPLGGGAIKTLASGQNNPLAVALDSATIYWATGDGMIMKVAKP